MTVKGMDDDAQLFRGWPVGGVAEAIGARCEDGVKAQWYGLTRRWESSVDGIVSVGEERKRLCLGDNSQRDWWKLAKEETVPG